MVFINKSGLSGIFLKSAASINITRSGAVSHTSSIIFSGLYAASITFRLLVDLSRDEIYGPTPSSDLIVLPTVTITVMPFLGVNSFTTSAVNELNIKKVRGT